MQVKIFLQVNNRNKALVLLVEVADFLGAPDRVDFLVPLLFPAELDSLAPRIQVQQLAQEVDCFQAIQIPERDFLANLVPIRVVVYSEVANNKVAVVVVYFLQTAVIIRES